MTPTAADLLASCIKTLTAPVSAEDAGSFLTARLRTVASLNRLVALECAQGAAVRIAENAAIRTMLAGAGPGYAAFAAATSDGDCTIEALDAANAKLRKMLIELHEAVERARQGEIDRKILALYRWMAERRELPLPMVRPA